MPASAIRLSRVSFAFRADAVVLSEASLHLTPGWAGLVGANGIGKSTLLRLLAGDLMPASGEIHVDPRNARRTLCPQGVEAFSRDIEDLAGRWDGDAQRLRGRLHLDPDQVARWPTLSPGERKRWQIGAALAADPDILLLDEPSNHLDAEGRDLLIAALDDFRGIGVVVSHDRELLDRLTNETVRLCDGRLQAWSGSYSLAREEWAMEASRIIDAREALHRQEKALRRRLAAARRRQAAASTNRRRHAAPRDSDARSMEIKNKQAKAQASAGRTAEVIRHSLDRTAEELGALPVKREKGGTVSVSAGSPAARRLLQADADRLCVPRSTGAPGDAVVVLRDVHLVVHHEDRIWVCGRNGSGKTTLLATLLASAGEGSRARVLHLPQELPPEAGVALLDDVRGLDPEQRGRVLQRVATLGVDPERLLASAQPSQGEARKLLIAYGLGREVAGLVLDEPTNHLDLPSIERLEDALAEYPGALVLVTHDAGLARRVTSEAWTIEDGRVIQETSPEPT